MDLRRNWQIYFPCPWFDWEVNRSIAQFNKISGIIANTMVFMDHPHIVKKAVPFILLETNVLGSC